ncbi:MAG TPA: putative manganese-dependent inorganic diphosphatase [Firmicutes bacterium]|nr:putative manganese-dependent inorganic diphosphatase [Bacillota bacterium]
MQTVYVFGHKNPDTDSVCSAIAYAGLKNELDGEKKYVPARLGEVSRETQFVLDTFGIPAPMLLEHVYTEVADVACDPPLSVPEETSLHAAWDLMLTTQARTVMVVDKSGRLAGLATVSDVAKAYLKSAASFGRFTVPVSNILSTLQGEALTPPASVLSGNIVVAAMQAADVQRRTKPGDLLVVGNRDDVHRLAVELGVGGLVVTGGYGVAPEVLAAARDRGITVIHTPYDTYDAVRLIQQSIPLSYIAKRENLITFRPDDLIADVKEKMVRHKYHSFPVVDENGKPIGLLGRRHVLDYNRKEVILVDHNEPAQSVAGLKEARILEVVDHHRIGGLETDQPVVFLGRPVGSTATIVYDLHRQHGRCPSPAVAGLMCAAILSDTLLFKSPTCTAEDRAAAATLAETAHLDMDSFGHRMFEAGMSLADKSPAEILYSDFKEYYSGQWKIGIGQVNTIASAVEPVKAELLALMRQVQREQGFTVLLFLFTDIIKEGSEVLFVGDRPEVVRQAFRVEMRNNSFYLPGVVSRKKKVLPQLLSSLSR